MLKMFLLFHGRSNVVRQNRRYRAFLNAEQVARREQLPSLAPQVSREECRRRRANPVEYRRTIYRLGMWANPIPNATGRFRECSAGYYRYVHKSELLCLTIFYVDLCFN